MLLIITLKLIAVRLIDKGKFRKLLYQVSILRQLDFEDKKQLGLWQIF